MGGGEDVVGSWRVLLGAMRLAQPVRSMASASRWHAHEVGMARASQWNKWHGDGGLALRAQRLGGPEMQCGAAAG